MPPPPKTTRIHSLDALRAVMMLLGLVIHSAITYNVTAHGNAWPLKDPETTHIFTDLMVLLIHSFRMPVFFVIAGFFGAMLFYERQPLKMMKNRVLRIAFPFMVFVVLLWPIVIFAFGFSQAVLDGEENPLGIAMATFADGSAFLPRATMHLWFLYYLFMITGVTVILGLLLKPAKFFTLEIKKGTSWIIQRPLVRVAVLAGIIYAILSTYHTFKFETSVSWIPDAKIFIFYLTFYLAGWVLYTSRQHLDRFMRHDWAFTIMAFVLVAIKGLTMKNIGPGSPGTVEGLILLSAVMVSLFVSGITGLFIRYSSKYSARMRYLSDASYWVYLIHFPVTIILPAAIFKLPIPAVGKFLIVLAGTTFLCFVSYHYLVRSTFIGKFLNGRTYPKKAEVKLPKVNVDSL